MAKASKGSGGGAGGDGRGYEVGYGRPPRATQFKKGTSGNPGGKRKRSRPTDPGSLLHATLMRLVPTVDDGVPDKKTVLELTYLSLANAAARGSLKATQILCAELKRYPLAPELAEADHCDHGAEVRRKFEDMARRMRESGIPDGRPEADRDGARVGPAPGASPGSGNEPIVEAMAGDGLGQARPRPDRDVRPDPGTELTARGMTDENQP